MQHSKKVAKHLKALKDLGLQVEVTHDDKPVLVGRYLAYMPKNKKTGSLSKAVKRQRKQAVKNLTKGYSHLRKLAKMADKGKTAFNVVLYSAQEPVLKDKPEPTTAS